MSSSLRKSLARLGFSARDNGPPLRDLFRDKETESNFPVKGSYWTKNFIDNLIQEETVRQELDRAKGKYTDELVDFIVHPAKRVFCIAVLAPAPNIIQIMKFFRVFHIDDILVGKDIRLDKNDFVRQMNSRIPRKTVTELDESVWKPFLAKMTTNDAQWKILVPVFSTERTNYTFPNRTILPMNKINLPQRLRSGFSEVHKVKIESGHFVDPSCAESEWPEYFAVKEIIVPDYHQEEFDGSWTKDVGALKTISSSHEKHIVRFMTAFTRGWTPTRSYYMIFEWADGGSLEDLFIQWPNPELNETLTKQTVTQLIGLFDALQAIHDREIRHGDLKPKNGMYSILRFGPTDDNIFGTLKIGDWGMSRVHDMNKVPRKPKAKYDASLYEPSEVRIGVISYQDDVWSMGCIILEIVIWLLDGYDEVKKFRSDITGYSRSPSSYVVKWLDHMVNKESRCPPGTALGDLLRLVRDKLLVVESSPETEQTTPET
ncbi:kinase-like domain-containing protein [Xylaria scruposa]|nr:kinase-like domain-containing protein [Xylaria scruposa]